MAARKPDGYRPRLERAVSGSLRSQIAAHGPITRAETGSAAKRVIGQLLAVEAEQGHGEEGAPRRLGAPGGASTGGGRKGAANEIEKDAGTGNE